MNSKISETIQHMAAKSLEENQNNSSKDLSYSEIPGLIDPTLDVLNQLNANLKMLSDLHLRLQFTLREIKSVIR